MYCYVLRAWYVHKHLKFYVHVHLVHRGHGQINSLCVDGGLVDGMAKRTSLFDYFFATSSSRSTSPSGVQGENITEAVPESAEETADYLCTRKAHNILLYSAMLPQYFAEA